VLNASHFLVCMCGNIRVRVRACACVSVRECVNVVCGPLTCCAECFSFFVCMCGYICVRVCMCVFERER